ncbi:TIGR04211 family SH3 domain-containing protein [Thalassotalea maritima]|uniref:TIGR04211 family SH3 domain-containing protein n=1 Tax=Thalassotalea maritima TaxID=3242416 RepID=UPI0035298FC5
MRYLTSLFISVLMMTSPLVQATTEASINRYISDDLFIYFHSGPGTQYRILGSIDAGSEVDLTGAKQNGFSEIIDSKQRQGWVDDKFLSEQPGLRHVAEQLNQELQSSQQQLLSINTALEDKQATIATQLSKINDLANQNNKLVKVNQELSEQLDTKGLDIKVTYFSYGAGVLLLGLFAGLVLPRLVKPKSNYSSWG